MYIVIDSGATKADWQVIDNNSFAESFQTIGLSPFFLSGQEIVQEIECRLPNSVQKQAVEAVHFFGTGCSSEERRMIVEKSLQTIFPKASITVSTDIHGAAIALYGSNSGIAAILGTGVNSCLWNGQQIVFNPPSLGYILGDEGSGAHLGGSLIKHFLNNELPAELLQNFKNDYPNLNPSMVLDAVYRQPRPNAYLAQYALFLARNKDNLFVKELILHCFEQFFAKQINKYPCPAPFTLRCIGSVAFYFKDFLQEVASRHNTSLDLVVKQPIQLLAQEFIKRNEKSID